MRKRGKVIGGCILILMGLILGSSYGFSATKELTIWGWDFRATKDLAPQVEQFEAEHPDVKIKTVNMSSEDVHNKFLIATVSGTGAPDMTFHSSGRSYKWFEMGEDVLYSLNDVIPNYKDIFLKVVLPEFTYKGKIWAAPYDTGPFVVFYRQDIFDEVGVEFPSNWQDFIEVGKRITTKERYATVFWEGNQIVSLIQSRGGALSNEKGDPLFNTPITVEICQYIVDAVDKHKIAEYANNFDSAAWEKIKEGRWATIPSWYWYQSFGLKDMAYKPELDGKWRISRCLPWTKDDPPTGANFVDSGIWLVSRQTRYPEIAKQFAALICSKEAQVNQAERRGIFPINLLALEELAKSKDPFFGGQSAYKEGLENLLDAPDITLGPNKILIRDILKVAIERMIYEGVATEKALADAVKQVKLELR